MSQHLSTDEKFILKINTALNNHLADENFGVTELYNEMGLSRSQLHRRLKKLTGTSTSTYIREYRLRRGHELLKSDVGTASEIAYRVGFSSPSYFHTAFRKLYGYTPGEAKFHNEDNPQERKKSKAPLWLVLAVLFMGLITFLGYREGYMIDKNKEEIVNLGEVKEKSIAVLAFKALSNDQSQKYLGMGLAAEVINILDDVEGLKVIGQTSTFYLMEKNLSLDSIAKLLKVNYILEGTILEYNGKVDIIAVLSDGETGQTMISPKYVISSDEVLNLKEQIAKQVAYELKMKVNEDVIISSEQNDAKLLALEQSAYYRMGKSLSPRELIAIWDECISIDSTYIPCIANRSRYANSSEEHLLYLNRLMELDSTNAYTYFVKGNYFFEEKSDFQNAYLNYNKMLEISTADMRILSEAAYRLGHFDIEKGLEHLLVAMNRDPLYFPNYRHLSHLYLLKGQYKRSVNLLYEGKTMTDGNLPWEIIFINIYGGYYKEAEIVLNEYLSKPGLGKTKRDLENTKLITEMFLSAAKHEGLEFEEKLKQCIEIDLFPYSIASALTLYGDNDRSFEWLERGYETKDMSYFYELKYAPWFNNMRSDPRWPIFMNKLGMPGYEYDKIKP